MKRLTLAAALSVLGASVAGLLAQQSGTGATPKPLVPVAASTLAHNPDAYYGEYVSLIGAVEQNLSRSAFTVDQDATRSTGDDVLVLVPTMIGAVDRNSYVTILGEVVRFDPADVARKVKDYALDLAPDVVEKYRGRPAVVATAVINPAMVDVAKRPPPPLTPEEDAYDKLMKRIGPAFNALRQAVADSDAGVAATNVAVLKPAFLEAETFWKSKGKTDATGWARDARAQADSVDRAAAAGNWDEVKTSTAALGKACQACHAVYRDRLDDGTSRIKWDQFSWHEASASSR